jgi:hypothetical protein
MGGLMVNLARSGNALGDQRWRMAANRARPASLDLVELQGKDA